MGTLRLGFVFVVCHLICPKFFGGKIGRAHPNVRARDKPSLNTNLLQQSNSLRFFPYYLTNGEGKNKGSFLPTKFAK